LEIDFQSQGPWRTFGLGRATNWSEPFLTVPGLTPTALGDGHYRFEYPIGVGGVEFFRVVGM